MSLNGMVARAMAVALLDDQQLQTMHLRETKREGIFYLPYEIADLGGRGSIRDRWNIPDSDKSQEDHAGRILKELLQAKITANLADLEDRHDFDWKVHHARIDFAYRGAGGSLRKKAEEVPF